MNDTEKILHEITERGYEGITERELTAELQLKVYQVRKIIRRLFERGLIFRSLSQNKWKLVKHRTDSEEDYNKKMEWKSG